MLKAANPHNSEKGLPHPKSNNYDNHKRRQSKH